MHDYARDPNLETHPSGNITALNLPGWFSLIKDTLVNLKYQLRDKTVETIAFNREVINDNWKELACLD